MLYAQGNLAGARKLQEQALEARAVRLGKEHPDTLRAMNNLAGTLYAQGDRVEARKLQELVLEARAEVLGKEHPDTLRAMKQPGTDAVCPGRSGRGPKAPGVGAESAG